MSYGVFGSELSFDGDLRGTLERRAAVASLEYRVTPAVTLQVGAGLGHGGRLVIEAPARAPSSPAYHEMLPGWQASISGSWRVVDGVGRAPFVLLSATLGAAGARTREETARAPAPTEAYTAFDLRLSAVAGKTFFEVLSPYAMVAVFGGPILWRFGGEDRSGTDRHHFQLGAGLAVSASRSVHVFAEGAPLGARSATLGAGMAF